MKPLKETSLLYDIKIVNIDIFEETLNLLEVGTYEKEFICGIFFDYYDPSIMKAASCGH